MRTPNQRGRSINVPTLRPSAHPHLVLNAEALSRPAQEAVDEFFREAESRNTRESYRAALAYWGAWHRLRFGRAIILPVPLTVVQQFVVDHLQRQGADGTLTHLLPREIDEWMVRNGFKGKPGPLALNTVQHRLAVLSKAHQVRDDIAPEQNPCRHVAVRDLLATTRKAYAKRGAVPRKLDALTRDRLQAILATCGADIRGIRDRALLLFAWSSGGRRRSEVAAADLQFLTRKGSGFAYRLAHSKTNQSGRDQPENYKPIQGEAAEALRAWLLESGIRTGPIFRRVLKGGRVGGALSSEGVAKIVKSRCQEAALGGRFSAHSLRSGFLTEAGAQEIPLKTAMAMSGHKSVSVAVGYMHVGALDQSPAATLLENLRSIRSNKVRRG